MPRNEACGISCNAMQLVLQCSWAPEKFIWGWWGALGAPSPTPHPEVGSNGRLSLFHVFRMTKPLWHCHSLSLSLSLSHSRGQGSSYGCQPFQYIPSPNKQVGAKNFRHL